MKIFRFLIIIIFFLLIIIYCNSGLGEESDANILFLGLWDRAFPVLDEASKELNIPVDKYRILDYITPKELSKKLEKIPFEKYDLIYILQINQNDAHLLSNLLSKAKDINPDLKVIELDYRSTHEELLTKDIMKADPKVREYWENFSKENLKRLLIYSQVKYLEKKGEILPPVKIPEFGFYHPQADNFFKDWESYTRWYREKNLYFDKKPWVAVILRPDYVIYDNSRIYDALIKELQKNEINVYGVFGSSEKLQDLIRVSKPSLMTLQHHSGPEGIPKRGEESFLEQIDIPYLYGAGLLGTITIEDWKKSVKSAKWSDYTSISRHELYGIIEPHIIGAKGDSGKGYFLDQPIPERVESFVSRIKGWINLQNKPNANKKVAIIYFHKYLSKADLGRPAMEMGRYLNISKSIFEVLHALKDEGYNVKPLPNYAHEIISWMQEKGKNIPGWSPAELEEFVNKNNPILIPEQKYKSWFKSKLSKQNQNLVIKKHGEVPGNIMVINREGKKYIVLPVIQLGNVILAPQPDIGVLEDKNLMKSRTLPPSHNFLAFYWWLQEEFKADAFIHFGAFGKDVFLPGKEIFLSKDCFPDIIMADIPNIYIWPIENIGIGTIAKRRTYAVLIDHLTASILPMELSFGYSDLENLINQFMEIKNKRELKREYRETITKKFRKLDLAEKMGVELREGKLLTDEQIYQLLVFLSYAKTQNSPSGMHVFGVSPPGDKTISYICYILQRNTDFFKKLKQAKIVDDMEKAVKSEKIHRLIELLVRLKLPPEEVSNITGVNVEIIRQELKSEVEFAKKLWDGFRKSGNSEMNNLLKALDGGYISPGPGGTALSNPQVLPTGRNMYGISPRQVPTRQAWEVAKRIMDKFLKDHKQKKGKYPQRVAFSLTGMETFRDMGIMEAQILYLAGIRPSWNPGGLVNGLEIIPSEELNHPRIDPLISVSGIYIKSFPYLIELLDEAIKMAAEVSGKNNFIKVAKEKIYQKLVSSGIKKEIAEKLATIRIFGSKAGESGARLIWLLPRTKMWEDQEDILEVWNNIRSHYYSKYEWSKQNKLLYQYNLKGREVVFSSWGNNLYGPLTNHHYPEETGGLALACQFIGKNKPEVFIQDLRNRKDPYIFPLREVINAELLATFFNKKWIESQMDEGYQGATQFMQIADNLFQWTSVKKDAVSQAVWEEASEIYLDDKYGLNILEFFMHANPYAFQQMISTMLEASRKGYWEPTPMELKRLVRAYASYVVKFGYNAGPYTGRNKKFHNMVKKKLEQINEAQLLAAYVKQVSSVSGMEVKHVKGKKLQQKQQKRAKIDKSKKLQQKKAKKVSTIEGERELIIIVFVIIVFSLFIYGYRRKVGGFKS